MQRNGTAFAKALSLTTTSWKTGSLAELGRSTKASISIRGVKDRFPGLKFRNGAEAIAPWSSKFMLGYSLANWGQNEDIMSREGNMQVCQGDPEGVRESRECFLIDVIFTKCSVPFSLNGAPGDLILPCQTSGVYMYFTAALGSIGHGYCN